MQWLLATNNESATIDGAEASRLTTNFFPDMRILLPSLIIQVHKRFSVYWEYAAVLDKANPNLATNRNLALGAVVCIPVLAIGEGGA
ncbi:hypothetical protein C5167_016374 [Papaver somniferum]|nr:hypothetical protein C5167_016374 [Papaver somniferum]